MTTTTTYGTWCNTVDNFSVGLDQTVVVALGDYADDYNVNAIAADYRTAINDALPDGISLCGDEFYGPYHTGESEFGRLDIKEIVNGIDFWEIAARHDKSA